MSDQSEFDSAFKCAEQAYETNDMDTAISQFLFLAQQGVPEACQYLGLIYRTGDGVSKDKNISGNWYDRYVFLLNSKANSGCKKSKYSLAKLYQYGEHVTKNEKKALTLFRELADLNFEEAEYAISTFYGNGWCGCEKNLDNQLFWLKRAAQHGYLEAMYYYGVHLIAIGDLNRGKKYLFKAACSGFWLADEYLTANPNLT